MLYFDTIIVHPTIIKPDCRRVKAVQVIIKGKIHAVAVVPDDLIATHMAAERALVVGINEKVFSNTNRNLSAGEITTLRALLHSNVPFTASGFNWLHGYGRVTVKSSKEPFPSDDLGNI